MFKYFKYFFFNIDKEKMNFTLLKGTKDIEI